MADNTKEIKDNVDSIKKSTADMTSEWSKLKDVISESLNVFKQISDALDKINKSMPTDDVKDMAGAVDGLGDIVVSLGEGSDNVAGSVGKLGAALGIGSKSVKDLGDATKGAGGPFGDLSKKLGKGSGECKDFADVFDMFMINIKKSNPTLVAFIAGGVSGLIQGFKNLAAIGKGVIEFTGSLIESLFHVAAAIIAIPFKLFNTLIDMAESGGGGNELAQAYEKVRKEFGAFKSEAAATTIQLAKNFKGFNETGLSTFRIFGTLAEKLEYSLELVKAFGMSLGAFTKEFEEHGGRLAAYQKGLGLTAEEFAKLGEYAISTGQQLQDVGLEITKYTLAFSGGVIDKRFSREVQKAIADVKHFGGATMKEIARSTAYAKGLHIELSKIVGVMDSFNTFDQAAENAAKLAQAFGMNVDAMKLVAAQSPDEMLEHLRDSFQATGKSVKDLSRQELQLMASSTGLSEDVVKLAMSEKNRGKSLKDIEAQAEGAKKKQMSQTEAMGKLADAIERLIKSGEQMHGGFFDQFFKGMLRGMQWSQEFWKLMMNIRIGLRQAYWEGVKFGKWLVGPDGFPGLQTFIKTLGDLFDPSKIKAFFARFADVLKDFVKTGNVEKLMDDLKDMFFSFFDEKSEKGKQLLDSMGKMFDKISQIAVSAIEWLTKKLVEGMGFLTDIISGKVSLGVLADTSAAGGNIFMKMLLPIWEALKTSWDPLYNALTELMSAAWERMKVFFSSGEFRAIAEPILLGAAAVVFGPAVANAFGAAALQLMTRVMIEAVKGGFKLSSSAVSGAVTGGIAVLFAMIGLAAESGMRKFKGKIIGEFTDAEMTIGSTIAGLFDFLTAGLLPDTFLQSAAQWATEVISEFKTVLDELLPGLGDTILNSMSGLFKSLGGIVGLIAGIFTLDGKKILNSIRNIIDGIVNMSVSMFMTLFVNIPMLLYKAFVSAMGYVWSAIPDLIGSILESLGFEQLGNTFKYLAVQIRGVFSIVSDVVDLVVAIISYAVSVVRAGFTLIEDWIQNIGSSVGGTFKDIREQWDTIISVAKISHPMLAGIVDAFLDEFSRIKEGFEIIGRAISSVFDVVQRAVVGLRSYIQSGTEWMKKAKKEADMVAAGGKKSSTPVFNDADAKKYAEEQVARDTKIANDVIAKAKGENKSPDFLKDLFGKAAKGEITGDTFQISSQANRQINDLERSMESITVERLNKVKDKFTKIFNPASGPMAQFVAVIDDLAPQVREAATKLQPVTDSMEVVAKIFTKLSDFMMSAKILETSKFDPRLVEPVILNIKTVIGSMKSLGDTLIGVDIVSSCKPLVTDIVEITNVLSSAAHLSEVLGKISTKGFKLPQTLITDIGNTLLNVSALGSVIDAAGVKNLRDAGLKNDMMAAADIIKSANELDRALSDRNLNTMNIKAKLARVAKMVGITGAKYKIENNGVQVTVNLSIELKASDIEKVIIQRKESIIRDRLNHVDGGYSKGPLKEADQKIPDQQGAESKYVNGVPD